MSNEAPILTIPNVNDVACLNGFVALIEYIEHEYAWLKKLASNVIGEEQESICYESVARYDQAQTGKIEHFDPSSSKSPSL
jgi:hypothetical protein